MNSLKASNLQLFLSNRIQISEQFRAKTWDPNRFLSRIPIHILHRLCYQIHESSQCWSATAEACISLAQTQKLQGLTNWKTLGPKTTTMRDEISHPRRRRRRKPGRNGRQWHLKAESISVSSKLRRKIYTFPSNPSENLRHFYFQLISLTMP